MPQSRSTVRYEAVIALGEYASEIMSELDHYGSYFSEGEQTELKALVARLRRVRDKIDETE